MRAIIVAFCLFISTAAFAHTQNHERNASGILDPGLIHMMKSAHRRNHRARNRPKFLHHVGTMRRRYAMHYQHYSDARPRAWCGWEMRRLVGNDPGPSYNLARNWTHWGYPTSPHVGAIVVWPHHVGKIVGREGDRWLVLSGNDGHAVRTRARSLAGAIAFREI